MRINIKIVSDEGVTIYNLKGFDEAISYLKLEKRWHKDSPLVKDMKRHGWKFEKNESKQNYTGFVKDIDKFKEEKEE